MVAACGQERRLRPESLCDLEAQDAAAEPQRALQVGDLQVDVADADLGINRAGRVVLGHGGFLLPPFIQETSPDYFRLNSA